MDARTEAVPELAELRAAVLRANLELVRAGLVTLAFGNASGIDRESGIMLIKPSGVPYDELSPADLVPVRLIDGEVLDTRLRPSSDTPTHLVLYRRFADVGGVVHTHSTSAVAFAQAGWPIPPLGTTHADHFYGPVPVTRQLSAAEVNGDYETQTGLVIVETFERFGLAALDMPAVLVASHGPFTWGPSAAAAADNAVALEAVAAMAIATFSIAGNVPPMPGYLLDKHHRRKHGPDAYYGQGSR